MNTHDYYSYFEALATVLSPVKHEPTTGNKAFFVANIEEAIVGFRSELSPAAEMVLIAITPQIAMAGDYASEIQKRYEGGFIVIAPHQSGDFEAMKEKSGLTENVAVEIIKKIHGDSLKPGGHPMWGTSLSDINKFSSITPYINAVDGNWIGWQVIFSWSTPERHMKCFDNTLWINGYNPAE
jgi:hypothetical protein